MRFYRGRIIEFCAHQSECLAAEPERHGSRLAVWRSGSRPESEGRRICRQSVHVLILGSWAIDRRQEVDGIAASSAHGCKGLSDGECTNRQSSSRMAIERLRFKELEAGQFADEALAPHTINLVPRMENRRDVGSKRRHHARGCDHAKFSLIACRFQEPLPPLVVCLDGGWIGSENSYQ